MSRAQWIKHALVFVASIILVWLAGIVPGMMMGPGAAAPPLPAGPVDAGALIVGIASAWPIYIALAITQALTFNYLKTFTTPIYLACVFVLALLLAWRYQTSVPVVLPASPPAATSSQ